LNASLKFTTIASATVITGTLAGSLLLSPVRALPATSVGAAATLPLTGSPGGVLRIRHGIEMEAIPAPTQTYEQFVPPAPTVALRPATPRGTRTIAVPVYRQAMTLDCETSALRMGLATFGHYYSDAGLYALEKPDTRAPVMGANHTVVRWGDPYTNFVGNVWGSDTTPTGYGVYWPVIQSIARSHGLPNAYGGEGFAPASVYNALSAGHPVEVWVETNWARPWLGTWTAWDGRKVRFSYVEHAVILSGVSATQVRVNDPLHGTQYWISKSRFETVWHDFNNMAVIFQ
jgi:uncharacterized protein YvpB